MGTRTSKLKATDFARTALKRLALVMRHMKEVLDPVMVPGQPII